jgi:phosphate transport system permease protein
MDKPAVTEEISETLPAPKRPFRQPKLYSARHARKRVITEWFIENFLMLVGLVAVAATLLVLAFMLKDALPLFLKDRIPFLTFVFGDTWLPISEPPQFGILAFVVSSLIVTVGAAVLAIPVGFACAVYLAELAPKWVREVLKPTVELLAAIPSVVLGFLGLMVLNPYIAKLLNLNTGLTALTGAIMLAFMAMPTVISISEDALTAVPKNYREGSLALGSSLLSTIRHVVLPAARSGLIAAAMLGIGRALGETMVVLMVCGGSLQVPLSFLGENSMAFMEKMHMLLTTGFGFLQNARTMTATLASEMGETAVGSAHYHALFAIGALLCLISFAVTIISDYALRRVRR